MKLAKTERDRFLEATSIREALRMIESDKPKRERTQPIQVQHTPEPTMPKPVTQQTYAWAKAAEVIITRDIGGSIGSFRGELAATGFTHHADERDGQMQRAQSADHFKVSDSEISRQIRKCLIQEKGLVNGGQKFSPYAQEGVFSFSQGTKTRQSFGDYRSVFRGVPERCFRINSVRRSTYFVSH